MAVKVTLKYLRHSNRKLQPVAKQLIGVGLGRAMELTQVSNNDSGRFIFKALKMAEAAAQEKEFSADKMVVTQILSNQGPKIKRARPNARGRSNAYQKHLAHLTIILDQAKEQQETQPKTKKALESAGKAKD